MMPCPDLDRLVDDACAGLPGAADRLDAHAATCEYCAAEAVLADDDSLSDLLAPLATETCPPDLIEAALTAARAGARTGTRRPAPLRAPDRDAARPQTRRAPVRRWATVAALALVALVAVRFWPDAGSPTGLRPGPSIAEVTGTDATPDEPTATEPSAPPSPVTASSTTAPAPQTAPAEQIAAARPARSRPIRTRRVPTRVREVQPAPAPAAEGSEAVETAVSPVPLVAAAMPFTRAESDDAVSEPAEAEAMPSDKAAARDAVYLALGLVANAQRSADAAVSSELRRVSTALLPTRVL